MTRLAIIFSLLFATPAWAGEVDGNSFFCESVSGNKYYFAVEFADSSATTYDGPADKPDWWRYSAGNNYVSWWEHVDDDLKALYKLNRKNLRLSININAFGDRYYQCQLMEINAARHKVLAKRKYQDEKEREGNKF